MTIAKDGRLILDLSDWRAREGPKTSDQWREDRSAMEVAKSWLAAGPELPREISALLASHSAFGVVTQWDAELEARLSFDDFPGEPRNTDLAVYARDEFGDFMLAVEAKADEPFGQTIGDALAAAVDRRLENPRSNSVSRVEQLAEAILGQRGKGEPALGKLRYQLLTATAGAIRAAERSGTTRVVVVVHEFWTRLTSDAKHSANAPDLDAFVSRLSHGTVTVVEPGVLRGPFLVPGAPLFTTSPLLFIGKARSNVRHRNA